MTEIWREVIGFEGRYEVSSEGRLRSMPKKQRYLLRNGLEAYRNMKAKPIAQQKINSGYFIAHLHKDNKRTALLVHRLVAFAFCAGYWGEADVNHKSGTKTDNRAANLEWLSRSDNHNHAVDTGLWLSAKQVTDPLTEITYPSISRASRELGICHHKISAEFIKGEQYVPR